MVAARRITIRKLALSGFSCALACAAPRPSGPRADCELTRDDLERARTVITAYRDAWLDADATAVLALFTRDAVLLPHHGDPPVVGEAAIRAFWWPPGSGPFKLLSMEVSVDEVGGSCGTAFARGTDQIAWASGGKTYRQRGTYLNVLRKMPDGSWKISHHMWDDPAPQVE